MKLSKYNNIITTGEYTIIFNTYTGGILRLNAEYSGKYQTILEMLPTIPETKSDLIEALEQGGMLIDDDIDEETRLIFNHRVATNNLSGMSLTIAPTLACNFVCPYCYEKGKEYKTMDDRVINRLIEYINENLKSVDSLGIAWYGGEPLLALNTIRKIRQSIILNDKQKLEQSIVTNGYLLTEDVAKELAELGINKAQVTVDGPPQIHNKSRKYRDGRDTFHPIIQNISKACEYINITVRMNVNKKTIEYAAEVFDYLDQYNLSGKVAVYLAPIDNANGSCNASLCYNRQDFSHEEVRFIKENVNRGYLQLGFSQYSPTVCGATNVNSFVIDPLGDMYKCWEEISDPKYRVGDIFHGLHYNDAMKRWLTYDFLSSEQCKECSVFPICSGGCPKKYLDSKERLCNTAKYNMTEVIELMNMLRPQEKK